jgi:DnaJ family protein C protein 13
VCVSSPANAEELARAGGLPVLAALLHRCVGALPRGDDADTAGADNADAQTSTSAGDASRAASCVLCTLGGLAAFPRLHASFEPLLARLAPDVVACAGATSASMPARFEVCHAALGCASGMAGAPRLREALLAAGLLWAALRRMLEFDAAVSAPPASAAAAEDGATTTAAASVGALRNGGALLAARCVARLAGVGGGGVSAGGVGALPPPPHPGAAAAVAALLTPPLAALLAEHSLEPLLRALASETRAPRLIWSRHTRAELAERLDALAAASAAAGWAPGRPDALLASAAAFRFAALAGEQCVGGVFVSVFNERSSSGADDDATGVAEEGAESDAAAPGGGGAGVSDAPAFAAALRDYLIARRWRPEWRADEARAARSGEGSENENATDADDADAARRAGEDLVAALRAVSRLLRRDARLAAPFCGAPALSALAEALPPPGGAAQGAPPPGVPPAAAPAAAAAAADALGALARAGPAARDSLGGHAGAVLRLFCAVDAGGGGAAGGAPRAAALRALHALSDAPGAAWAAAHNSGALYLLSLALPPPPDDASGSGGAAPTEAERCSAAALLTRLLASPPHGGRVAALLSRYLPRGLVSALASARSPSDALAALRDASASPERLWSPACASAVGVELSRRVGALRAAHASGEPDAPPLAPGYAYAPPALAAEPSLAGVYVRHFLRDTTFPLTHPHAFIAAAIECFLRAGVEEESAPHAAAAAAAAAGAIAAGGAAAAAAAASLGYVPRLLALLARAEWDAPPPPASASAAPPQNVLAKTASSDAESHRGGFSSASGGGLAAATAAAAAATAAEASAASAAGVAGASGGALRLLHALCGCASGAEALASAPHPGAASPLMAAAGALGASRAGSSRAALALETLKRALGASVRGRDALVAHCLEAGLLGFLLSFLDWRAAAASSEAAAAPPPPQQDDDGSRPAELARVLAVDVLMLLASQPGAHASAAASALDASETWGEYRGRRHDLFLPAGAAGGAGGVAGLLLAAPGAHGGLLREGATRPLALLPAAPE